MKKFGLFLYIEKTIEIEEAVDIIKNQLSWLETRGLIKLWTSIGNDWRGLKGADPIKKQTPLRKS